MIKLRKPKVHFMELLRDGFARDKRIGMKGPARKVLRFIGITLAWFFLQFTITANQVTIGLLVSYYLGMTIVAVGGFWIALIGVAVILFGDALDLADGIVGRRNIADGIRKNKLDRFRVILLAAEHHEGMPALLLLAFSIHYVLHPVTFFLTPTLVFILGTLGAVFEAKTFHALRLRDFLMIRSDQKEIYGGTSDTKYIFAGGSWKKKLVDITSLPMKYVLTINTIALVVGQLHWVIVFYGLYIPVRFIGFFGYTYLQFKKIEDSRVDE
jgi:hypothetical protein